MNNPFSKLFTWYFTKKALPYWSILLLDCIAVVGSLLAMASVSGYSYDIAHRPADTGATLSVLLICFLISFRIFHTYSGVLRFSSFSDLLRVAYACTTAFVLEIATIPIFVRFDWYIHFPISMLLLAVVITICVMWMVRIWAKSVYDVTNRSHSHERAFIYGVREGGVALAKNINTQENSPYVLFGFITPESDMVGRRLMNKQVFAPEEDTVDYMIRHHIGTLIVSPKVAEEFKSDTALVDKLISARIKIMMMPDALEWDGKSDLSYTQLRQINVEDLLPRDKIEMDMDAVAAQLTGETILITGAAGSIGSEMVRQVARFKPGKLVLIDQAETPLHDIRLMMARTWPGIEAHTIVSDIRDKVRMEEIFEAYKPAYVFHAAAYKHVPMMEDNPYEAVENNISGTRNVADLAVKYGTRKFVMVSTDKAVNPTNVMGCSKRICEIYVQALDRAIKKGEVKGSTAFVTTRFGNVLGSNGSVIPLFEQQIKAGGPVTVTHPDIIRFFMLIPEACKLVLEAGTMGKGGEIFVFDMGKPVRIADLAMRMIRLSGAKDIEIKFTGLRDGEKLYEEVLNDKEITLPTFHPKIKIAKVREYEYGDVDREITELISDTLRWGDMEIVARMKRIVPEFVSQNSKYESLDTAKTK